MHNYTLSTGTCSKSCDIQCAYCDSGTCLEPMLGYRLKEDGSTEACAYENCMNCVNDLKSCDQCLEGYYYEQEKGCLVCDSSCRKCNGPTTKDCI